MPSRQGGVRGEAAHLLFAGAVSNEESVWGLRVLTDCFSPGKMGLVQTVSQQLSC